MNKVCLIIYLAGLLACITVATTPARADLTYSSSDVGSLFNSYRFAQAKVLPWPGTYWPFYGDSSGSGIDHKFNPNQPSPAQKYDALFNQGTGAADWEEANHTCVGVKPEQMHDCQEWYGHCNGWTGAALFNPEPDYNQTFDLQDPKTGAKISFNFADIKALLSEAWLDASVSFEGTGTTVPGGDWIFDPNDPVSRQTSVNNSQLTNYDAYWDVTPRALFYALTTYIGSQGVALAMDRFTGDEIWNQPIMAYRFVPITGNTDKPVSQKGLTLYPVKFGVKLYWANDDVAFEFKRTDSLNWNVTDSHFSTDKIPNPPADVWRQENSADNAVNSRYIAFTLFFDSPVSVSADGTQITSAGRIVGDGVWDHADPAAKAIWYPKGLAQSQTHPDFLWRPDIIVEPSYRNPFIDPRKLYEQILKRPAPIVIE